jgi:hypothetical protein
MSVNRPVTHRTPTPSVDILPISSIDAVEAVGDTLLQRDALETLPDRPVEVVADLRLDLYYGDEDETEALYSSQAKRGTTAFHAVTLYVRVRNKRYTLAVRQFTRAAGWEVPNIDFTYWQPC